MCCREKIYSTCGVIIYYTKEATTDSHYTWKVRVRLRNLPSRVCLHEMETSVIAESLNMIFDCVILSNDVQRYCVKMMDKEWFAVFLSH